MRLLLLSLVGIVSAGFRCLLSMGKCGPIVLVWTSSWPDCPVFPLRLFFFLVGGEVHRLAVGLSLGVALLVDLHLLPVLSSVLPGGCCARNPECSTGSVASTVVAAQGCWCPAYVTRGNECVVLSVWCVWAKNGVLWCVFHAFGAGFRR